jgi:hypothetical protein
MPEISDFQRTTSEFAKSEQKYPVKITLEYVCFCSLRNHTRVVLLLYNIVSYMFELKCRLQLKLIDVKMIHYKKPIGN